MSTFAGYGSLVLAPWSWRLGNIQPPRSVYLVAGMTGQSNALRIRRELAYDNSVRFSMSMDWRWLSIAAWLAILLAACAPAETVPDLPMQTAEPGSTIEDTATPPLATTAPAEPTVPEATATVPEAPRPTLPGELELVPESPTKPVPNVEIAPMPEGSTAVSPSDPYSLELVEKAKADLAQRTGIPVEEIILQEFQLVTWSDASLGCPQPGMAYAQVPVDGYLIMLRAGLGIYNYHGGGYPDRGPFLCEGGIGTKIIVPPPADSIDK